MSSPAVILKASIQTLTIPVVDSEVNLCDMLLETRQKGLMGQLSATGWLEIHDIIV